MSGTRGADWGVHAALKVGPKPAGGHETTAFTPSLVSDKPLGFQPLPSSDSTPTQFSERFKPHPSLLPLTKLGVGVGVARADHAAAVEAQARDARDASAGEARGPDVGARLEVP